MPHLLGGVLSTSQLPVLSEVEAPVLSKVEAFDCSRAAGSTFDSRLLYFLAQRSTALAQCGRFACELIAVNHASVSIDCRRASHRSDRIQALTR
jgi:hypothetical protein